MLSNGKRIAGRYEIVQPLGGGGMAMVYQAHDLVLDRWVAIKVMNDSLKNQNEFVQRFIREAKAAGSMSHANIVSVYDIGRENSIYFMVMEYIEGTTLADYLHKNNHSLTTDETLDIAVQICEGLTHAHLNGIIHRDIKLQNIMRTVDGRYKVTDFGISFFSHMNTSLTQTGTVMGSAHYFSPEQASGGKVSYASDVYSLGVVIYKMVTKRFPFDAKNSVSIALKHLQEPVPDPRKFNPSIPEDLVEVIYKALKKKQEERYQSIEEMKHALLKIDNDVSSHVVSTLDDSTQRIETEYTAFPPRQEATSQQKSNKKSNKLKLSMSFVIAFIVLGAIYLIGWEYWQKDESDLRIKNEQPNIQKQDKATKNKHKTERSQLTGSHPWWKELPKPDLMENDIFSVFQASGENGEYDVSLLVGAMPKNSFKYNIYVVDGFSSRLILSGRNVSFHAQPNEIGYTPVNFHVTIPNQLLPNTGIVKIEIYHKHTGKKMDATDNLLQQWGKPPEGYQVSEE